MDASVLVHDIKRWGRELGLDAVGIADVDLADAEAQLLNWLARDYHGEMGYMSRHGSKRSRPGELVPGTVSVIAARQDYFPPETAEPWSVIENPEVGYVSRYALGRDYHKVLRRKLARLASRIEQAVGSFGFRVFVDSAPVLEKPLAAKAGLGWIGKHSNLLSRDAGSWYFLGEIYTDLPLPPDVPTTSHCGSCRACIDACPTGAIVEDGVVDARLCISYLTIELRGAIPEHLRPMMGNRIYGCDDCQLVCPFNKFSKSTTESDYAPRHGLDQPALVELFGWTEEEFLTRMEGSAIRRIGYECWLRNIAVALGNGTGTPAAIAALAARRADPSALVREHVGWALQNLKRTAA